MFKHAAVALDLSDASEVIVSCLEHFKSFGTEKLTLITSLSHSYPGGASTLNISGYEEKLDHYKQIAEEQGFETETKLDIGINAYPPAEILKSAKDAGADWLILGNRGENKVRELLLGGTANEILQRADVPVFLLNLGVTGEKDIQQRKLYCVRSCREMFTHILHPTDFSEIAKRAFETGLACFTDKAKFWTLLHVQAASRVNLDNPEEVDKYDREDTQRLTSMQKRLDNAGAAGTRINIRHGAPAEEILQEADEQNASMFLMGSQGRGFIERLFVGGVSLQVSRLSHIPVLLIPAER